MKITQGFLERLSETKSMPYVIGAAEKELPTGPKRPTQPRMMTATPTATEAENYVLLLNRYENDKVEYDKELKAYRLEREEVYEQLATFIKGQAGLNTIPEQYREKVWNRAYAEGHSDGYYEVYLKLESLVDIFQ